MKILFAIFCILVSICVVEYFTIRKYLKRIYESDQKALEENKSIIQ